MRPENTKPAATVHGTGSGEAKPNNGLSFQEYEQWTPEKSAEVMLSRETLQRLYEHARHEIGCPHLNENLTSNTDCNCGWYEIETEVLATLRVPTPPASPTVTETLIAELVEKWGNTGCHLSGPSVVKGAVEGAVREALLRAAERQK